MGGGRVERPESNSQSGAELVNGSRLGPIPALPNQIKQETTGPIICMERVDIFQWDWSARVADAVFQWPMVGAVGAVGAVTRLFPFNWR